MKGKNIPSGTETIDLNFSMDIHFCYLVFHFESFKTFKFSFINGYLRKQATVVLIALPLITMDSLSI